VELVEGSAGCWFGAAKLAAGSTSIGQFFVTLCDEAWNCGKSSNKARNYSASSFAQAFSFVLDAGADTTGLFPDPTTVTVSGPAGVPFTVELDGVPRSCTGTCFVTVTGDGAHLVRATAGGVTSELAVPIDENPPVVQVASPTSGARFRQGEVVATSFTCSSALELTACSGPETVDTATPGDRSATFTATDQFGLTTSVTVPYYVDGTPPEIDVASTPPVLSGAASATFEFAATDPDDPSFSVLVTCQLDDAAPEPCTSPHTATVPTPVDGSHTFTLVASDRVGNSTTTSYSWVIDTTAPVFQSFIGPSDPTTQTTAVFVYTTDGPVSVACTLDGTAVPCGPTGATIEGLSPRAAPYVFRITANDEAGNPSTMEHSWRVFTETELVAEGVLPSLPRLRARLTTPAGAPIAGQVITFTRTTGPSGFPVACTGGVVRTNADGWATCNVNAVELLAVVLAGGYTATFATTPPYLGSRGSAGVL
jgi:hypothetical protein